MTHEWIDRVVERGDLSALDLVERHSGGAAWTRRMLRRAFNSPTMTFRAVAATPDPQTPIGFFVVQDQPSALYLMNLAVALEWRRRGAGSFALERVHAIARERRASEIRLDVQEWNLPAQLLYRKAGYHVQEIRHGHYGDQDGYRMVCPTGCA